MSGVVTNSSPKFVPHDDDIMTILGSRPEVEWIYCCDCQHVIKASAHTEKDKWKFAKCRVVVKPSSLWKLEGGSPEEYEGNEFVHPSLRKKWSKKVKVKADDYQYASIRRSSTNNYSPTCKDFLQKPPKGPSFLRRLLQRMRKLGNQ